MINPKLLSVSFALTLMLFTIHANPLLMLNTLISADSLNNLLDQKPIIIDCRFDLFDANSGISQYSSDHISGAHYLHLNDDMSGEILPKNGRHPLPLPGNFNSIIESLDATEDSTIVVYDDNNHCYAARAWWMLQGLGYKNTWVLNGGYTDWKRRNFPTNNKVPQRLPINSKIKSGLQWALPTITLEEIKAQHNVDSYTLIDARDEQRYLGKIEPVDPHAGHIPNAINQPWLEMIDVDGFFKSRDFLTHHWNRIADNKTTIHYCGSGVTACVNILSSIIAGQEPPTLYPGGWSQWCNTL